MQYPSDTIQNKRQSILFGITVWLFIVRIYSHEALPTILTYFTQIQAVSFFTFCPSDPSSPHSIAFFFFLLNTIRFLKTQSRPKLVPFYVTTTLNIKLPYYKL